MSFEDSIHVVLSMVDGPKVAYFNPVPAEEHAQYFRDQGTTDSFSVVKVPLGHAYPIGDRPPQTGEKNG